MLNWQTYTSRLRRDKTLEDNNIIFMLKNCCLYYQTHSRVVTFSKSRLNFKQKLWEKIHDYVSVKVYAFFPKQTSCRQVRGKNWVNLCCANPLSNRELIRKSQNFTGTMQQVRKRLRYWRNQINPGFNAREVTAFNFWSVFAIIPSIPEYSWDFLTLNGLQSLFGDCLVSPITFP